MITKKNRKMRGHHHKVWRSKKEAQASKHRIAYRSVNECTGRIRCFHEGCGLGGYLDDPIVEGRIVKHHAGEITAIQLAEDSAQTAPGTTPSEQHNIRLHSLPPA